MRSVWKGGERENNNGMAIKYILDIITLNVSSVKVEQLFLRTSPICAKVIQEQSGQNTKNILD